MSGVCEGLGGAIPPYYSVINTCSKQLQHFVEKHKTEKSEIFIIDAVGGTACLADLTSDFDQGDEDKYIEVIDPSGNGWHVANPEKDRSSSEYQVQVSTFTNGLNLKDGIVVFGVKVDLVRKKLRGL